jgi:hypothetical protein
MSTVNDGGPAFPTNEHIFDPRTSGVVSFHGMTLRDYFAAKALAGMWSNPSATESVRANTPDDPAGFIARTAYEQADAMLAARANGGGKSTTADQAGKGSK